MAIKSKNLFTILNKILTWKNMTTRAIPSNLMMSLMLNWGSRKWENEFYYLTPIRLYLILNQRFIEGVEAGKRCSNYTSLFREERGFVIRLLGKFILLIQTFIWIQLNQLALILIYFPINVFSCAPV